MVVGTRIKIIDGGIGSCGCNGKIGVVVKRESTNGLLPSQIGYNVLLDDGSIWRIHLDAAVNILPGIFENVWRPEIKNVVFNDPATVVMWSDGTKTVVKCQPGDVYSKETGLALCIAKKFLGNKSNFNETFKRWIPEEVEETDVQEFTFTIDGASFLGKFDKLI